MRVLNVMEISHSCRRQSTAIARETFDGRNAHVTGGVERAIGRVPPDVTEFAEREARAGAWSASGNTLPSTANTKGISMQTTWYQKSVLVIAGLAALLIGLAIAVTPHGFYAGYGIALGEAPDLLSEIRAPGANLAALGLVVLAGIVRSSFAPVSALIAQILFFAFAAGRIVSLFADGMPGSGIILALIIELVIGVACLVAFRQRRAPGNLCSS